MIIIAISRIHDPDFVKCIDCDFRITQKELKKRGRGFVTLVFCVLTTPKKRLHSQRGCSKGRKKSR